MKEKEGIENPIEWYNDFWTDKKNGFSLWFTGGWLIGIVALNLIALGIITMKIVSPESIFNNYIFISSGVISYLICYFLVFKNDQYLKYFKEFENWSPSKRRTKTLTSIGFILSVIALFFISLLYF
ncbi:hypothetical protein SCB49_10462 [unidentified eubacterium SCB49]|nr:hypothetical protein SCB49_10462 [unidentified eubacterium SCB49]